MNHLQDINSLVRGGSRDGGISSNVFGGGGGGGGGGDGGFGSGGGMMRWLVTTIATILLGPLCTKCIKDVERTVLEKGGGGGGFTFPSFPAAPFGSRSNRVGGLHGDDNMEDQIMAESPNGKGRPPAGPPVQDRFKRLKEKNDIKVALDAYFEQVKEDDPEADDENTKRVKEFFKTVAGEDMEIDWSELKEVLDLALKREFEFDGFSKDVCRSMVALMDVDRTGKLGLDEFVQLWKSIRTWKSVFKMFDEDSSGHLSSFELRQALTSAGYHVNNHVLQSLVLRYGDSSGQITFDDFIMCAVKLKAMIEIFKERDVDSTNEATFTLEDWVEKTLYS